MDPEQEIAIYLRSKGVQHAVLKDMLDQFAHNLAEAQRAALAADPGILENALIDLTDPETGHTESGR